MMTLVFGTVLPWLLIAIVVSSWGRQRLRRTWPADPWRRPERQRQAQL